MEALGLINNDSVCAPPLGGFQQCGRGGEKCRDVLDLDTEVKSVVMAL
jgi:hypothetical protein